MEKLVWKPGPLCRAEAAVSSALGPPRFSPSTFAAFGVVGAGLPPAWRGPPQSRLCLGWGTAETMRDSKCRKILPPHWVPRVPRISRDQQPGSQSARLPQVGHQWRPRRWRRPITGSSRWRRPQLPHCCHCCYPADCCCCAFSCGIKYRFSNGLIPHIQFKTGKKDS